MGKTVSPRLGRPGQLPFSSGKVPLRFLIGIIVIPNFLGCFYSILLILAGKEDMRKSLDEFAYKPDPTTA